jgi:Ca-activated chloride channel family protein
MTLRVRSDRRLIRSTHRSERFVLVELDAPESTRKPVREPVNVAFVLDRSGSMGGRKIELAKKAVEVAIERLLPTDRFSVVFYDDRIDLVVESTPASREAKSNAIDRIRAVDARGSTDLAGGWLRGAEQVALHQVAGAGVDRVLLLTDGLANVGMTDHDELVGHASELRARGVTTTTFGVGADFDERLLTAMADAGGGHFYFIERPEQITDLVASEVGELLEVVARDAAIEVTAPGGVRIASLSPRPTELRGSRFLVHLGDLVAGQRIEIVLRLKFGYGQVGQEVGVLVAVTDKDGVLLAAGATPVAIGWTWEGDAANDAQPRDREVDRRVAGLFADHARQEAIQLNRLGDYREARREIAGVRERILAYAGSDAELNAIAGALLADEAQMAAPMPELARKQRFATASYAMRSRSVEGKSLR